jgi:hypothetical protein
MGQPGTEGVLHATEALHPLQVVCHTSTPNAELLIDVDTAARNRSRLPKPMALTHLIDL